MSLTVSGRYTDFALMSRRLSVAVGSLADIPRCPAHVRFIPAGSTGRCNTGVRADPRSLDSAAKIWSGRAPEHDADHGETDEGRDGSGIALEISGETTEATDPGDCSFDDPSFRQHLEADCIVGSLDDVDQPGTRSSSSGSRFRTLVAAVGIDAFDKGKQAARATVEDQRNAVAILDVGGMNGDAQQEAERVDQDMPLATRNLLARIVALRIERRPPF
jgi:hypothetical protein